MKVPISDRLRCCAELVPQGARVADVGCDHGYLGIYLLQTGRASQVFACDLRPLPLQRARENALRFHVADQMQTILSDGLQKLCPEWITCIVIAGMGGDNIASILREALWVRDPALSLILQPQSSGNDLRRALGEMGFSILEERLVQDNGHLYMTMLVQYGGGIPVSPGEQFCSKALLQSGSPLLPAYFERNLHALERTVQSLQHTNQPERLAYYTSALRELREMRDTVCLQ